MHLRIIIRTMFSVGMLLTLVLSAMGAPYQLETTPFASPLQGKVLYVGGSGPGNYTKIQDALNDSLDGDTVFVYDDASPYYEHLLIQNSITLQGENKDSTEINGSRLNTSLDTVNISASHVSVSGLRIASNHGHYYQAALKVYGDDTTIADCRVNGNEWIGVYLYRAAGCELRACEFEDNLVAVYLVGSSGNIIQNCTCVRNSDGIDVFDDSDANQLVDCVCTANGFDNIHIQQSSGNQIIRCVCEDGYDGISLAYTPGTVMRGNTMANNYANFGIGSPFVSDYLCEIDTSNTVNGEPIFYLVGQQDRRFNGSMDLGFLGLVNCANISVENLTFSHNFEGMLVVGTSQSSIEDCRFQNNDGHGLYVISSSGISVNSCEFQNSFFDGILLYDATQNILENCSYANSVTGVNLQAGSHHNILRGQTVRDCSVGVSFASSGGNLLRENAMDACGLKLLGSSLSEFINDADPSNTVNQKPLYYFVNATGITIPSDAGQVVLANCTGCDASGLNLSAASVGIELAYSTGNTLADNILDDNSVVAIYLNGFDHENTITGNTMRDNNYGIDVVASHGTLLQENALLRSGLGIALEASEETTMTDNSIHEGTYGIYLEGSSSCIVTGNTVDNATAFGMYLLSSADNILASNTMLNCSLLVYGGTLAEYLNDVDTSNTVNGKPVYYLQHLKDTAVPQDAGEVILVDCSGCTVRDVTLDKGTDGILLAYSSNNSITGNTILGQSVDGIDLSSGSNNDNTLQGNILEGNGFAVDIEYSQGNTVKRNRLMSNEYGVLLYRATDTAVRRNTIMNNLVGANVVQSLGSIVRLNNFVNNYAYGLSVDACPVDARWNWWGALKGPQGSDLAVANKGQIIFKPWRLLPVLLAGVLPSSRLHNNINRNLDPPTTTIASHYFNLENIQSSTSMETQGHHTCWNSEELLTSKGVNIK